MLKRYVDTYEYLPMLEIGDVDASIPLTAEHRRIEVLLENFDDQNSLTTSIQSEETDITDVSALFDTVIESSPCTEMRLNCNVNITLHSSFESAIVKILCADEDKLTSGEVQEDLILRTQDNSNFLESSDNSSLAAWALNKKAFGRLLKAIT